MKYKVPRGNKCNFSIFEFVKDSFSYTSIDKDGIEKMRKTQGKEIEEEEKKSFYL